MSGSVNHVTLIGNLGADPEVRSLNDGRKVVSLRIATSESWKDKNSGERQERTTWHQVVIFNEHLAKVAEQYLRKGSKIFITGQLQTRKWQDQSGNDRYSTEIVLQNYRGELVMLDGKPRDDGSDTAQGSTADDYSKASGGSPANFFGDMDDEIPFMMEWR